MFDRPWQPPGHHWPNRPSVIAGRDETAGGTWLGLNDAGVVAAVSNRRGSLGPARDKRSRGELPLMALDHTGADGAARAVAAIEGGVYRAFNLIVADRGAAYWLRHRDAGGAIEIFEVPTGITMLTAGELDDPKSPRIQGFLPRFRAASAPDPGSGDWRTWEGLLASRDTGPLGQPEAAMTIADKSGFGTVSSSLIALPGGAEVAMPVWRFAAGPPGSVSYHALTLLKAGK
jgi:hypothetical protein